MQRKHNRECRQWVFYVLLAQCTAISVLHGADASSTATRSALLTQEEIRWLTDHPQIRIAPTPDYQPIEFFDEAGRYSGITADYFKLIEQKLGCEFAVVRPTPAQWQQLDPKVRGSDVITASAETPRRREFWSFTEAYLTLPTYVITRVSAEDGLTPDRLAGSRVTVVGGWAAEEFLRGSHTNLLIEAMPDAATALQRVSFGLVDAFISELPVATAWMEKKGFTNLKISAEAGFTYRLGISVRKDWPELRGILDKVLATITPAERQQIFNRWVTFKTPDHRREMFQRYLGWSAAGLASALVGFVIWNRSLAARVRVGTQVLRDELGRRTQVENSLRASEEKFAKAFRSSPLAISLSRFSDGKFLDVNEAFLQMHGLGHRDQVIGRTSVELGLWPDPGFRQDILQELRRHRRILNLKRPFKRASSGEGIGLYSVELIEIGGEEFLIALANDITERTEAEEARVESEQRLCLALEAAHMGTFDWDLPHNRLTWSHWHAEHWGYAAGEFDGSYQAFVSRLHPDDLPGLDAELARCRAARETFAREFRVVWPNRSIHWMASTGEFEFDAQGNPVRMLGTVREITARKEAEQALRELNLTLERRVAQRTAELAIAKERAEAADRLKSAFLATMSHELRTPLNSIIGFTGIMLQGLAGPLNPEQGKQLGMVQGSARHLLALINDVLDISKIEAGQLEVRAEPFDLLPSLDKVAGVVRPLVERKGLALRVERPAAIPRMTSDRVRVEQVLLNLLNNAVKFTERGSITLLAEVVPEFRSLNHREPQPAMRLRVSDTGIGIKSEDMVQLFQPFRQIDSGLTRQHEGTGLGLAICRRLAEMLGGEISVQSVWGEGSTFTFIVPLNLP